MVVDRYRQRLLSNLLADHILIKELKDVAWLWKFTKAKFNGFTEFFLNDLITQVDAFITDIDARASDQLFDLLLALSAERTLEQISALANACHAYALPEVRDPTTLTLPC